ncbi:DNA-binding response regulator [Paenibacillus baekrokdamisoli]|uniref:DNA-binding response regulator n=1 Tax=Paenibacillus baekrokdamisoli TaxID=1712516 RepID=A0A3G9J2P2_9BACL|nr:response regulator transcription factor [Paenibacillus baekrokdamisoli]MBB3072249.1 DNA-binding NarL/FixJ family response regulator [Paenibacillus baekrokdamisoli]BBH24832.1 DNA-binding response regulator [Paenibacillus baekrokdamisoli]
MSSIPIRVMIVEDDPDWRRGLTAFLNNEMDLDVIAEAEEPEKALQLARELEPDVILLDIMLADSPEGLRLAGELSGSTGARIIMLTSMEDRTFVVEAFRAGAVNYLVKSDFSSIPDAVRKAAADHSAIDATSARQMLEEFRRLKKLEREYEVEKFKRMLTPSEVQLLSMIHDGYSQTQIAEKSFLSIRTVKNHVTNILRKLGGKSSKEAAQQAKDNELF